MKSFIRLFLSLLLVFLFHSCSDKASVKRSLDSITESDLSEYVKTLGSDEFIGRKPFTGGERKTIEYLVSAFRKLGLEPAFGDSYLQAVPMVEITVSPAPAMLLEGNRKRMELYYRDDYVIFSRRITEKIFIDKAEMVFAGYGIVAPEYNWNDYEGLDVKGKIVVVMVNDPGYGSSDTSFFHGHAMTYYGRWTYKYEEAARQGALGIMIIHDDGPAGYGWTVVRNGAVTPKLYLAPDDHYAGRCALEGWFTQEASRRMIRAVGQQPDSVFALARTRRFKPFCLGMQMTVSMTSSFRYNSSMNVMGMIRGRSRPDECIVYSAHWDHLGVGEPTEGDSIFNGAVDNGLSMAWMMEIARAFTLLRKKPQRTVLFLAPTAEEQGLIGAEYYVQNPLITMNKTVANINNDLMLPMGPMRDVMVTGYGQSEMEDYLARYAAQQGRYVLPDPNPHTGMYYRADHFPFARAGVPALFARGNCDHRDKGKEYAAAYEKEYLTNRYHHVTDEYDPLTWDMKGIAEDAQLLFLVGLDLADSDHFPQWKEGSEFRKMRMNSLPISDK